MDFQQAPELGSARICDGFRAAGLTGSVRRGCLAKKRSAAVNDGPRLKYYLSYSGRTLPLNLVSALEPDELENRNTYFRAEYDAQDRMTLCEKIVYGEVELRHSYRYRDDGGLAGATIEMGDDTTELAFGGDAD
jgi:hypothetical protein